jgi:hypothetical protein
VRLVEKPLPQLGREVLAQAGRLRFPVAGNCMSPVLQPGDVAVVAPFGTTLPRVGEVLLFVDRRRQFTVHRLVAVSRRGEEFLLAMKGDHTSVWDPVVSDTVVVGRVTGVERAGQCVPVSPVAPGIRDRLRGWTLILRYLRARHYDVH